MAASGISNNRIVQTASINSARGVSSIIDRSLAKQLWGAAAAKMGFSTSKNSRMAEQALTSLFNEPSIPVKRLDLLPPDTKKGLLSILRGESLSKQEESSLSTIDWGLEVSSFQNRANTYLAKQLVFNYRENWLLMENGKLDNKSLQLALILFVTIPSRHSMVDTYLEDVLVHDFLEKHIELNGNTPEVRKQRKGHVYGPLWRSLEQSLRTRNIKTLKTLKSEPRLINMHTALSHIIGFPRVNDDQKKRIMGLDISVNPTTKLLGIRTELNQAENRYLEKKFGKGTLKTLSLLTIDSGTASDSMKKSILNKYFQLKKEITDYKEFVRKTFSGRLDSVDLKSFVSTVESVTKFIPLLVDMARNDEIKYEVLDAHLDGIIGRLQNKEVILHSDVVNFRSARSKKFIVPKPPIISKMRVPGKFLPFDPQHTLQSFMDKGKTSLIKETLGILRQSGVSHSRVSSLGIMLSSQVPGENKSHPLDSSHFPGELDSFEYSKTCCFVASESDRRVRSRQVQYDDLVRHLDSSLVKDDSVEINKFKLFLSPMSAGKFEQFDPGNKESQVVYDTDAVGTANAAIRNESFAHILETYLPQDVLFGLTVKQFKEGNDQRGFEYLGALLEHNQMYGKGQSETKSRNFKILEAIKDVLYTRDGLATKKSLVAKNRHFLELFFGQLTAISPPFIGSRIYVELTTQYSDEIPYHHPKLGKKLQIEFSKQALRFWKQELGQLSTFLKKNISQLSRIKSSDRLYQVVLENIGDDRSLLDSFFIRKVFYEGQLFINADDFDLSDLKSLPNVISSVFLPKINQLGRMLRDGRTLSGAVHQKLMKTFIIMDYFDPAEFSKL